MSPGVSIEYPLGSDQNDIKLTSDHPTQLKLKLQKPDPTDLAILFNEIGAGADSETTYFHLLPSREFLLPNASIRMWQSGPAIVCERDQLPERRTRKRSRRE
jgi:hypothetical protein